MKQTDKAVKNNPGIYKRLAFDKKSQKWKDTGRYRAIRRVIRDGSSKKEQAIFDNFEDAKAFRAAAIEKPIEASQVHRQTICESNDVLTFGALTEQWKGYHYLQLEPSTQQTYDKRLPNLDYLKRLPVKEINASIIDDLVKYWVKVLPKKDQRETFEKELNLLKVILNYYRKRKDPGFVVPVLLDHYKASDIAKKATSPVLSLTQEQFREFLDQLRNSKTPFYPLALAQFCLGLRIGEVCGLNWEAVDLQTGIVKIECTIVWDQYSWAPRVKNKPKNGKIRYLVMPEVLVQELKRLIKSRDLNVPFLFHKNGTPYNRQSVAKAYRRALERMGLSHIKGTHWIRKTSATLANQITGDFYAVSRLMDHSSPNVTLRYVSPTNAEKQKVANALNSVVNQSTDKAPKAPEPQGADPAVPLCPLQENRPRLSLVKSAI